MVRLVRQSHHTRRVKPAERFLELLRSKVETFGITGKRNALDRSLNVMPM